MGPENRCRACQLQLCKSREARPHAALAETSRAEQRQETAYLCNTCGTALLRSGDLGRAGWSRLRPMRPSLTLLQSRNGNENQA